MCLEAVVSRYLTRPMAASAQIYVIAVMNAIWFCVSGIATPHPALNADLTEFTGAPNIDSSIGYAISMSDGNGFCRASSRTASLMKLMTPTQREQREGVELCPEVKVCFISPLSLDVMERRSHDARIDFRSSSAANP